MFKDQYKPFQTEEDAAIYLNNYVNLEQYTVISNQDLSTIKSRFPEVNIIDRNTENANDRISDLNIDKGSHEDFASHYDRSQVIVFEGLDVEDMERSDMGESGYSRGIDEGPNKLDERDQTGEQRFKVRPRDEYDTEIVDVEDGTRSMLEVTENNPNTREEEDEYFKANTEEEKDFLEREDR